MEMNMLANAEDFKAMFPNIYSNFEVREWIRKNRIKMWNFEFLDEENNLISLTLESDNQFFYLGIQAEKDQEITPKKFKDNISEGYYKIIRLQEFQSLEIKSKYDHIRFYSNQDDNTIDLNQILSITPKVKWGESGSDFAWESVFLEEQHPMLFSLSSDKNRQIDIGMSDNSIENEINARSIREDWLDSNELHHVDFFRTTAQEITRGLNDIDDKVVSICLYIIDKMSYNAFSKEILYFTYSDLWIVRQLQYTGVCDEYAVLAITLLRAIDIPAELKLLTYYEGRRSFAHACLEWYDGRNWRHLDPAYRIFDDRSKYRKRYKWRRIKVMTARFPKDSRSNRSIEDMEDPNNDMIFNTYDDFQLIPNYPGAEVIGYSY